MPVSKMKRLSLLVMKQDADRMMKRLMRLCCVEVTRSEDLPAPPPDLVERISRAEGEKALIGQAIGILARYEKEKKGLFARRERLGYERLTTDRETVGRALEAANDAVEAERAGKESVCKIALLQGEIRTLKPWETYELPFSENGTASTALRLGYLSGREDPDALLDALGDAPAIAVNTVGGDRNAAPQKAADRFVTVLYRREEEAQALHALSRIGFTALDMSGFALSAGEEIGIRTEMIRELQAENAAREENLLALAASLGTFRTAYDMIDTELAQLEAQMRLTRTESTVCLRGWVPEEATAELEQTLSDMLCAYELTDPEEGEEPPVHLAGNRHLDPFRMVIGLYALPKYGTFDPTFVMSIFYFIIFGAMLADFVYGLIISAVCFAAMRFLDLHGGTRRLVKLFGICGISCMLMGVLMGSYLGDLPVAIMKNMLGMENVKSLALLFDPVNDPISFLIFSLIIGAIHLLFGMGVRAYVLIKTGHPFAALFDVGSWYVLFAGIGLFFVNKTLGAVLALLGAAMLLFSQGREKKGILGKAAGGLLSLYKIVNYGSDLLSYSRIMALGMSSAVIANVINVIATLNGPSVVGWIMLIVIVPFGTVINLAINLLGSFVHTSRLQYIEFFDKFYEAGGRPFEPLTPRGKYTALSAESTDSAEGIHTKG